MRFFADTLCSVPHNLSRDSYRLITRMLIQDDDSWLTMKTLTMLALSKFSFFGDYNTHPENSSSPKNESLSS